ncbi:hypothetical protein [Saezia sanguinis]|uniref:hypothetical protein n=1 Tax=Saezia sanguinis TaxID=1965230 RepID=UPI00305CC59C
MKRHPFIQTLLRPLRSLLRTIGMVLIALLLLFEEWGWEPLKKLLSWLLRWPFWQRLSARIAALPPYGALATFAIPIMVDESIKIIGLIQMARGHVAWGIAIIVIAKIIGTALVASIYNITEPKLLQLPWFARFHAWWIPWKNQMMAKVRSTPFWQRMTAHLHATRQLLVSFFVRLKAWLSHIRKH